MEHDGYDKETGAPLFLGEDKDPDTVALIFGDSPTARIWSHLYCMRDIPCNIKQIAESAETSRPSVYKVFQMFLDHNIIIPAKKEKGRQMYKLNIKHKLAMEYIDLIHRFVVYHVEILMAKQEAENDFYKKWNTKSSGKRKAKKRSSVAGRMQKKSQKA